MHSRGFTLLEVLVASFILFLAISTATVVYSGAIKSKMSATSSIRLYGYLPLIKDDIKIKLQNISSDSKTGNGRFMGIAYQWSASVVEQAESIDDIGIEEGVVNSENRQIKLWKIEISLLENSQTIFEEFYAVGWLK